MKSASDFVLRMACNTIWPQEHFGIPLLKQILYRMRPTPEIDSDHFPSAKSMR